MKVLHMKREVSEVLCPYCSNDLTQTRWESEFHFEKHYKSTMCMCGKTVRLQVDFDGSGHDRWNRKESSMKESSAGIRTIEHKVEAHESPGFILKGVKK
ncbi:hypothetical protein GF351_01060 [Candidatus Woesearchaeota archaeon]|nr:hypothetical protein [Candidatus Woesearchaeota archaeon]